MTLNQKSGITEWVNDIHQGDAAETLAEMPESSVHFAMCSPPYYGLRDYGVDGQIGLEESLDEYIGELVNVAEELRRVLRPDGNWWLNLGDSFAGSWGGQSHDSDENPQAGHHPDKNPARKGAIRRKSKMLVPHRVAIALENAGWVVRADCPWVKPNPMPHSVKDRFTEHKEFVFHLTPEPDYWFDLDAVREAHADSTVDRYKYEAPKGETHPDYYDAHAQTGGSDGEVSLHEGGKNPGDIFEVSTESFPEAHFAVYPSELVEKPLKASCPPTVCAECGAPYERADEQWSQACDCETDETDPGIALDMFTGAGTTAFVAKRHDRRFVGIELNPEYVAMAQKRVGVTVDEPEHLLDDGETSLTAFADGGSSSDAK